MPHGNSPRSHPHILFHPMIKVHGPRPLPSTHSPVPTLGVALCSHCSIPEVFSLTLLRPGPGLQVLGSAQAQGRGTTCPTWLPRRQGLATIKHLAAILAHAAAHPPLCLSFQLKVDEFESNVNEIKDPYPSADFPGKTCPWQGSRKAGEALHRGGARTPAA